MSEKTTSTQGNQAAESCNGPLKKWQFALAGLLLLFMAALTISSMRQKSVTTDEIMYIAAGFYHIETGDFNLNTTNTPLMKVLTALPLTLTAAELPPVEGDPKDWKMIKQWQFSREFLYNNRIDADHILFVSRLTVVTLAFILGIYVFIWSKELFGIKGGFLSLFFYCFSPNLLAHAGIASQDFGLAAFMLIATYYFWQYMKKPGLRSLVLCGILTGCAFMVKTTAMFLAPVYGTFVLMCVALGNGLGIDPRFPLVDPGDQNRKRHNQIVTAIFSFAIIGLLTLLVINAGYGFQGPYWPIPFPFPFVTTMKTLVGTVSGLMDFYFAGKLHPNGLWYLTLASFLIKVPLALLVVLAISLAGLAVNWRKLNGEWLLLIFVSVFIVLFSFVIKSDTGLRYALGVIPFLHILAGSFWKIPWNNRSLKLGLLPVLGLWYLGSSLAIYPHYLAYFNESVGGAKNGYKYLSDANLDWGQDLKGLSIYMKEKGIDKINLAYFGSADADYYGINYNYLPSVGLRPQQDGELWWYEMKGPQPPVEPRPGIYAISSTLISRHAWLNVFFPDTYSAFRDLKPDDHVGYSILIFNITESDLAKQ